MQTIPELIQLARDTATALHVDPALFCALCEHESAGWQWAAVRYEPAFYARYEATNPIHGLSATELTMRATSFGLGQIMGQTARELGFAGTFLTELLDPVQGLDFACRKLGHCLGLHAGDVRLALLAYNGGSNLAYPDLVLARLAKFQPQ